MKKLNVIIALLFFTWLGAFLSACNWGEADFNVNAPSLDASYIGDQEGAYRAIIDGIKTYYSSDTYICTEGFLYSLGDVSITINNLDGSPASCEVSPVTRITVLNDDSPFVR